MIPFYRPFFDHSELFAALRPGQGRDEFESSVANRLGVQYGIAFAYGRSGIIAALKALGLQGVEVILPAYTCEVMAQAVVASGNRPVFVDIELADYNMNLAKIKNALTLQTRAIVATYMFGYPTDVDAIRAMTGDERIIIVEDRAQGLLSSCSGTTALRGDIGLCSFGPNKQLSTVQGGVIVTNSHDHYEKIKACRDHSMSRSYAGSNAKHWMRFIAGYLVFRKPVYEFLQRTGLIGFNSHVDDSHDSSSSTLPRNYNSTFADFQARIGLAQLRKSDAIRKKRIALAEVYDRELRDIPGLCPAPIIPGASYAYYSLRIKRRDQINFVSRMLAQGVAVDQTYDYAVPWLKAYRGYASNEYPCAEQAAHEVINLPVYPDLSTESAQYVAGCVRRALQGNIECDRNKKTDDVSRIPAA